MYSNTGTRILEYVWWCAQHRRNGSLEVPCMIGLEIWHDGWFGMISGLGGGGVMGSVGGGGKVWRCMVGGMSGWYDRQKSGECGSQNFLLL